MGVTRGIVWVTWVTSGYKANMSYSGYIKYAGYVSYVGYMGV